MKYSIRICYDHSVFIFACSLTRKLPLQPKLQLIFPPSVFLLNRKGVNIAAIVLCKDRAFEKIRFSVFFVSCGIIGLTDNNTQQFKVDLVYCRALSKLHLKIKTLKKHTCILLSRP